MSRIRLAPIALLASALVGLTAASSMPASIYDELAPVWSMLSTASTIASSDPQSQALRDIAVAIGREDLLADDRPKLNVSECRSAATGLALGELTARLAEIGAKYPVTMVNEDHAVTTNRMVAKHLAYDLRLVGYNQLALEALAPTYDPQGRRYPVRADGRYIDEPVFADLYRSALRDGYRLVSYAVQQPPVSPGSVTSIADVINRRERQDSEKLAMLVKTSKTQTMVLVGFSHVAEQPQSIDNHDVRWLAQRLSQSIGRDVFTIDAANFSSGGPLYSLCLGPTGRNSAIPVDAVIGLPRPTFSSNRPAFRFAEATSVSVPGYEEVSSAALLEAWKLGAPDFMKAVPEDRLFVRRGERAVLALPSGDYIITAWSPNTARHTVAKCHVAPAASRPQHNNAKSNADRKYCKP